MSCNFEDGHAATSVLLAAATAAAAECDPKGDVASQALLARLHQLGVTSAGSETDDEV